MKKLFVISGSSGVGKGTVLKEFLAKHPELKLSISCTTRGMRAGEVQGVNYHYISKDEFKKGIDTGDFLEWAEFSDNYYGTRKSFIEAELLKGSNVILEIETQGALQVKKLMPDAVLIFIAPPSFEELEHRLRGRKTESEEVILKRLNQAAREKEDSKQYHHVIVNDTIKDTVMKLEEIIAGYIEN